jgi:hypothetical protein
MYSCFDFGTLLSAFQRNIKVPQEKYQQSGISKSNMALLKWFRLFV